MEAIKLKKTTKEIFFTKKQEANKQVLKALNNCKFEDGKVYHTYTSGKGRFTSNLTAIGYVLPLLKAQGYKVLSEGNDSPRGGSTGDFIKVSKRALNFLLYLSNQ